MQTIEIKLPQIEGAELKNVTTNIENGYVVAEYGEKVQEPKFKKGDILYCEYFGNGGCRWICINKNINNIGNGRYFSNLIIKGNTDSTNVFKLKNASFQNVELDIIRLATDSEKQLLFNTLAKEGKYWDAEAKEVKDFIKVPESIGIYKHKYRLDLGLFIGFNNNSQFLGFHPFNKQFIVTSEIYKYEKVQCYLQPCKRENLKSGDTAYFSASLKEKFDSLFFYCKILSECKFANVTGGNIELGDRVDFEWYKLIPING